MCACRNSLLPVDPCTSGGMWVYSATRGHRVRLVLKGNKLYASLQQQQNSATVHLPEITLPVPLPSIVPSVLDLCENIPHKCVGLFFWGKKMQVCPELIPNCVSLGCIAFMN